MRRKQQRSEETRARLLEAAEACFSESGYDGTGVAKICRRAGVSKGAFYHHFETKQAVFLELLKRALEGLDAQMAQVRQDAADVPTALLHIARSIRQLFDGGSGRLPIFLTFWMQASHDPEIWKATIGHYRHYQAIFTEMIEGGIVEGSITPVNASAAAQAIVSLGAGMILQGLLDPEGADWGQVAEESIQILLEGLREKN